MGKGKGGSGTTGGKLKTSPTGSPPPAPPADPFTVSTNKQLLHLTQAQYDALTPAERKILHDYTDTYHFVNRLLGAANGNIDQVKSGPDLKHVINTLTGALAKASLPHNQILYRGTSGDILRGILGDNFSLVNNVKANIGQLRTLLTGAISINDGFSSATISRKFAEDWAKNKNRPLVLKIRAPKGSPALYLGNSERSTANESETLIQRGAYYRIRDVTINQRGQLHLDVDLIKTV